MDQDTLQKLIKMMQSENDADAVMGLRGLQALVKGEDVDFAKVIAFLGENLAALKEENSAPPESQMQAAEPKGELKVSGMPQCVATQPGVLMIIPPGQTNGESVPLPGAAAQESVEVAAHFKDVLVAAAINKSRFKLKVLDIKDKYGDVEETILQAEYDREGMSPIKVWGNVKGEVAALATVLRRAVANTFPDMVA